MIGDREELRNLIADFMADVQALQNEFKIVTELKKIAASKHVTEELLFKAVADVGQGLGRVGVDDYVGEDAMIADEFNALPDDAKGFFPALPQVCVCE